MVKGKEVREIEMEEEKKKRKERKIDFILVSNFRLFYKINNISKELCFISPYKHKYILSKINLSYYFNSV